MAKARYPRRQPGKFYFQRPDRAFAFARRCLLAQVTPKANGMIAVIVWMV